MTDDAANREREARLDKAAAALPREIDPEHDLWSGIRVRIDAGRVRSIRGSRMRLIAAAAALVLISVTATWKAIEWRMVTSAERAATTRAFATVAGFERSSAELSATLERRGATLDPRTRAVLERSLRTIDGAIAEARAALDADPVNPVVQAFVAAAYRQKIDFLRRANDVAVSLGP